MANLLNKIREFCKRAVLPQSRIQSIIPVNVCADGIFKLTSAICLSKIPYVKTFSGV